MDKKIYIFDFDNTIVDSLKLWYDVFDKQTFLNFGVKPNKEFKVLRPGKSNDEIANIFIELTGLNIKSSDVIGFWNKSMEYYYLNKIKLIAGVKEFLLKLKKNGVKLVLASATDEDILKTALKHYDLEIFDDIFTEANIGYAKHDKMFFETCLNKIGANPEDVILFEDSFVSVKSANSLGIDCVAVLHKYNKSHKKEFNDMCKLIIKDYKNIKLNF